MRQINSKLENGKKFLDANKGFPGFFLLPNAAFYILTVAVSLIVFFILWAILQEFGDKSPWIYSGIISSLIIISAVILREVIYRDARANYLNALNNYKNGIQRITHNKFTKSESGKKNKERFSLQRNSSILKLIEKSSESARISKTFADKHLGVFELCDDYLKTTDRELRKLEIGSIKWGALKNGRKKVKSFHKHHLISWAALESRRLTRDAKSSGSISKKIETAQKASNVLESALGFYPENKQLIESIAAVSDFIASIKVTHWIEKAEKAAFKEQYNRAISNYKDALFYLARENIANINKEELSETINLEIKKLRKLSPPI